MEGEARSIYFYDYDNHLWKSGEDQLVNQYQHGDGWRIFDGTNIRLVGCRAWHNLDDGYDFTQADNSVEMIECWAAYSGVDDAQGSITGTPNNPMPRWEGDGGGADGFSGVSVSEVDFISLDDTGMLGPRKAGGGLPELNFLKPAQGSNLVDAGVDVGISFEGSAPDIGPFEYTSASGGDSSDGGDGGNGGNGNGGSSGGCFIGLFHVERFF